MSIYISKPTMKDYEKAWMAGIIDCDGSITHNGSNPTLRITICSTNKDFLKEIKKVCSEFKGRIYTGNNPDNYKDGSNHKQSYHLTFYRKKETKELLEAITPFLVHKKNLAISKLQ